jgi:hypothetical protein
MGTVESISCEQAEALAGRICAAAAMSAQSECQLLELLGEFDAVDGCRGAVPSRRGRPGSTCGWPA